MIYVTGDKHGEIEMHMLHKKKRKIQLNENDFVIIAGDFGLIWDSIPSGKNLHFLNFLNNAKWTTLFVDGNHENHEMLAELPLEDQWGGVVGKVSDKIYHLRRGEIYTIEDKKILTFGGAASTDKLGRVEYLDWWKQEVPSHKEMEHCLDKLEEHQYEVDYVISHTCPTDVAAQILEEKKGHEDEPDPTTGMLSHIAASIEFKDWYFGHWHLNWDFGKYHCLRHSFKAL